MALPPHRIRPYSPADAARLADLANNLEVVKWLRDGFPYPFTIANAEEFLATKGLKSPANYLAAEVNGMLAGALYVFFKEGMHRRNVEVGYWLGQPYWGQGLGTAFLRGLTSYAFITFPDVERVCAHLLADNLPCARILEKAGFRHEGTQRKAVLKDGQLRDNSIYAVLREEWELSP
jgi:[ribosomal protein S5]-alanine N-acetyltransferase